MTATTIGMGVAAAVALVLLDYFIVAAAFLGEPTPGEWLLGLGLLAAVAGVALRQRWLLFATENVVLIVALASAARVTLRHQGRLDLAHLAYYLLVLLLGNLLIWPMARAAALWRTGG